MQACHALHSAVYMVFDDYSSQEAFLLCSHCQLTFPLVLGEVVVQYPQFLNLRACCRVADNVRLIQQLIIIKNIRIIKVFTLTSRAITLPSDIPL